MKESPNPTTIARLLGMAWVVTFSCLLIAETVAISEELMIFGLFTFCVSLV